VSKFVTLPQWTVELAAGTVEVNGEASQVVRGAAFLCQRAAIQRAPVDTGFLRSSITVSAADGGQLAPGALTAQVGPEAAYGAFVEFGTSRSGAQPYMTPAAEQAGEWFVQTMARQVGIR
jgi:HK97 gp10 family phage protein